MTNLFQSVFCWLAALAVVGIGSDPARAESDARTERIQFKKGSSSGVVEGRIAGYQSVDYLVGARKGQLANISLTTKHGATYFNILAPGKTEEAFFNGSSSHNQFEGVLPEDGSYRIRVYMMRSAARRNETANYRLEVVIDSGASPLQAPTQSYDVKVAGTDFHATGDLPCSAGGGQPIGSCAFGVRRQGQGSGIVQVTRSNGQKHTIFFDKGRATGYDASQADRVDAFKVTRQSDLSIVYIGDERYEIPDAVIDGG